MIQNETIINVKEKWQEIFYINDPFRKCFNTNFKSLLIFFPTAGYFLTQEQYNLICKAAHFIKEKEFFISVTEFQEVFDKDSNWLCANASYEEYTKLPLNLENSIYSKNGQWGIMMSHEDHAIISGSEEFLNYICTNYDFKKDFQAIQEYWNNNENKLWLENIKPFLNNSL